MKLIRCCDSYMEKLRVGLNQSYSPPLWVSLHLWKRLKGWGVSNGFLKGKPSRRRALYPSKTRVIHIAVIHIALCRGVEKMSSRECALKHRGDDFFFCMTF